MAQPRQKKNIKIVISENAKIAAIAAAIALVTFFTSYSIIYKKLSKQIEDTRAKIIEEYQRLVLSKDITKINSLRKEYHNYLYKSANAATLRNIIVDLATNAEVDILSTQTQNPEKFGDYTKTSFKINVRCSYHQLGKFIEGIENLPSTTRISTLRIIGSGDKKDYSAIREFLPEEDVRTDVYLVIDAYSV